MYGDPLLYCQFKSAYTFQLLNLIPANIFEHTVPYSGYIHVTLMSIKFGERPSVGQWQSTARVKIYSAKYSVMQGLDETFFQRNFWLYGS